MRSGRRNVLLAVSLALMLGIAAGAWWLVQAEPTRVEDVRGASSAPPRAPAQEKATEPVLDRTAVLDKPVSEATVTTTVVFPLKVDLELLASAVRPKAEGVGALGSDATARLRGSVHGAGGEGLFAEVLFVAGPNAGRRIDTSRDGTFGANDLYPGLSIVKITASGTPGSLREVLLRKGEQRETQLNIGYGRPGLVQGVVREITNDPLPDALVTVDGQETRTNESGEFVFAGVASGETFAVAEKPGYAAHMEKLLVVAGQKLEPGKLTYALHRAARLEVTIEERINVENEALLFVLPQSLSAERNYPWYRVNPVRIYPGGTKVIEDLPAIPVTLRLFHAGAAAVPPTRSVTLREQGPEQVTLHLAPAPVVSGVVTQEGKSVSGADVVIEAPQRSLATLSVLGESNYLDLEREVIPDFPPAVEHAKTNSAGEYVLDASQGASAGASPGASTGRYLHATSPDGKSAAWKLLRGGETRVDLALERARGDSELILQMDGRKQGLPVEIQVDGAPREGQVLPPGRDLHVGGLAQGTWKLTVRWNGAPLCDGMLIDVHDEVTLPVTLPEGAIVGQDAETRKRSGK